MQGRGVSTLLFLFRLLLIHLFSNHLKRFLSPSPNRKYTSNKKVMKCMNDSPSFPHFKPNLFLRLLEVGDIFSGYRTDIDNSLFTRDFDIHQIIHTKVMNEPVFIIPFAWFCSTWIVVKKESLVVMILIFRTEIRM